MKQTAVEWLYDEIKHIIPNDFLVKFNQAKEMEKKHIIDSFEAAEKDCGRDFLHGDLYYNETFKSK